MPDAPSTPDIPAIQQSKRLWLRIAVSVFSGLLTVALCMLWVRSYTLSDSLELNINRIQSFGVNSGIRRILFWSTSNVGNSAQSDRPVLNWYSVANTHDPCIVLENKSGFGLKYSYRFVNFQFSHWLAIVVAGATSLVTFPLNSLRFKFSLRTLLIATTLIAVVLALMVWAARQPN